MRYERAFMQTAAAELDRMPPDSAVKVLVSDYGKMRDACRAAGAKE